MFLLIHLFEHQNRQQTTPLHSNMFLLILISETDFCMAQAIFTFQYVSINTLTGNLLIERTPLFTFQYVSINTNHSFQIKLYALIFTFQYVSINTRVADPAKLCDLPLHSNMFLLIPQHLLFLAQAQASLHSNMFLLIPKIIEELTSGFKALHSNMFLLIRISTGRIRNEVALYIPICFY